MNSKHRGGKPNQRLMQSVLASGASSLSFLASGVILPGSKSATSLAHLCAPGHMFALADEVCLGGREGDNAV